MKARRRKSNKSRTSTRRQASVSALKKQLSALKQEFNESLQQRTATAGVLKVISASAFDLQTVLDRLIESVVKLCAADMGGIVRKQDSLLEAMAYHGFTLAQQQSMTEHPIEIGPSSVSGRVMLEGCLVHAVDVLADPEYKDLGAQQHMGFRTMLGIPLLRGGSTIGVLLLQRRTVRPCDLAHQAIALRPKLRVLYTTGNTITDKMKALLAEGTHFLLKPYTQNQLHDSVNNMLAA